MDAKTRARIRKQISDKTIYTKKRYINWRLKIFKRDRYTCQLCGKTGGSLQAHHIISKYKYPSKIYEINNGITLCYNCHNKLHKEKKEKYWARKFKQLAKTNKPKPRIRRIRKIK